ncbi:MAG: ABC transporter permease [Acidimicrobiales bacterium]
MTSTTAPTAASQIGLTIVRADRPAGLGATALAVATRTVLKYMRTPQLLVMSLANGAIFVVLFRYVFGGAIDLGPVDYVDFLMPGFVLTWVLVAGIGTATAVAEDVDQGFFDRLRSMPVPRSALLAGRALGDMVILAWSIGVAIAMGFLVGFRLHGDLGEALVALGLCLVCGFAFLWLFITMGLVAGNAQSAQGMSMIVFPVIFVSSAYVPVDSLPGWMQTVAEHQPITVMSNAVRSLSLGDPAAAGVGHTTTYWVVVSLLWAAGIVVLFAPMAVARYRRSS